MQLSKKFQKTLNGFLILLIIQIPTLLPAQVLFEMLPSTRSEGTINIYGRGTLSQRIPYEKIKGSAFWSDEWKVATIYGRTTKEKWEQKIKLNLASNEIYFKNQREDEQVVNDGFVRRIVLYDLNDSSKIEAQFLNGLQEPYTSFEKVDGLLQVLNDGKYQLLKQYSRRVMEGDSLFGTLKRYFFTYDTKYFIAYKYMITPLKKLNAESCLQIGPNRRDNQLWVSK